jgi:hypothetical protein
LTGSSTGILSIIKQISDQSAFCGVKICAFWIKFNIIFSIGTGVKSCGEFF